MRRLTKTPLNPDLLSRYQHGRDNWGDVCSDGGALLRNELLAQQEGRCAYCECRLSDNSKDCHIDHFDKKAAHPQKAFLWGNLYLSCVNKDSCGFKKDSHTPHIQTASTELLDPYGEIDLSEVWVFIYDPLSKTCKMGVRDGLSPELKSKALRSIEYYGLNTNKLVSKRGQLWSVLENLMFYPDSEYIEEYLRESPYISALSYCLRGV